MQDFGGPVGFRLASAQPKKVAFLVVQNANAYDEGLPDSFWAPLRELWRDPSPANLARIRAAGMSDDALQWNYTHGAKHPARVNPDSWVLQQALLARPGNKDIMLALLLRLRQQSGSLCAVASVLSRAPAAHAGGVGQERCDLSGVGRPSVPARPEEGRGPHSSTPATSRSKTRAT